jgi:cell division protease FtsH
MNETLLKQIETRKVCLENAKTTLKNKFIGIDSVIDKIIDCISLWYLMPEIQFKPLIVNLWGITGVGKTDLVRTLVNALNFTDKFIEIQMDMRNDYAKNIENYLENSGIETNESAILLLDEFQRYRTVDENAEMVENDYFNDVWMLLSDGKFQNNSKRRIQIMELLFDEMYYLERNDGDNETADTPVNKKSGKNKKIPKVVNYKYKSSHWTASRFKRILNLPDSLEDIMCMDFNERIKIMNETLKKNNINEGNTYEKLLIFISGNLDEAFVMANDVEDSERDADIYHELSKRINIIDIKNALFKQFKPEQIARFGNNHIIYPCLDRKSYELIIKKNSEEIIKKIENEHHIKINLSDVIFDIIYRNGVFPTQGVRPVISTVYNILGSNLPFFIYNSLIENVDEIKIDMENDCLISVINKNTYRKQIFLDIDSIKIINQLMKKHW